MLIINTADALKSKSPLASCAAADNRGLRLRWNDQRQDD